MRHQIRGRRLNPILTFAFALALCLLLLAIVFVNVYLPVVSNALASSAHTEQVVKVAVSWGDGAFRFVPPPPPTK